MPTLAAANAGMVLDLDHRHPHRRRPDDDHVGSVLVVEARPHDSDHLVGQLSERGWRVTSCRAPDGASAPCIRLHPGGHCPLLDHDVHLVLDVRRDTSTEPTPGERGLHCALDRDLPIVAAAPARPQPRTVPWAAATCTITDAAAFCAALNARPHLLRDLHIDRAVHRALRAHNHPGSVHIQVRDWTSGPQVTVTTERPATETTRAAITYAVRGALRHYTHHPDLTPVLFDDRSGASGPLEYPR